MTDESPAAAATTPLMPPYPGKTNQHVINAFAQIDPTFELLLACYGSWETNGLAKPESNRNLPYRGLRVTALRTPQNAAAVSAEALAGVDALLAGGKLSGIGVWSYSEQADSGAIKARIQQAIEAVHRLRGDTVLWKIGDRGHLYPLFDVARQMIQDAGLRPMAWLVNRLQSPADEAEIVSAAFHIGYAGVVFDYEASDCFGRHAQAAQLASNLLARAQQGEIDLGNLYLCCYPNLTNKIADGLPVQELHAVCEGGMMPMTYGEFFFADAAMSPAAQAHRVFTEWATDQYQDFLKAANAAERPQYRILGLFHQKTAKDPTVLPMSAAEAKVWFDQLAAFKQPFWSVWEPDLISDELYDLLAKPAPLRSSTSFQPAVATMPEGFHALPGVHGPADPENWAWEIHDQAALRAVASAGVAAVKVAVPGVQANTVQALAGLPNVRFVMARLFMSMGVKLADTPEAVAEVFVRQVDSGDGLAQIYNAGVRYFEVHNEPNLHDEGMWQNWQNGADFAVFFNAVAARLRAKYKDIKLGFPGLSPSFAAPNIRYPEEKFHEEAAAAIEKADFLALHAYWGGDGSHFQVAVDRVHAYCDQYRDKILLVTEFSNNAEGVDKPVKGDDYRLFYQAMKALPANLGAVFSYCLASTSGFQPETWLEKDGSASPIVAKVAQA